MDIVYTMIIMFTMVGDPMIMELHIEGFQSMAQCEAQLDTLDDTVLANVSAYTAVCVEDTEA